MSRKSPITGAELPAGRRFEQGNEQRKIASKGGKASGEARRLKKTLREELEMVLADTRKDASGNEMTIQHGMTMALIKQALDGNTKAYEIIRDTIGQKPVENVVLRQPDMTELNALTNELKAKYGNQTDGETAD